METVWVITAGGGCYYIMWLEDRDAAQRPTAQRTDPQQPGINSDAPCINSVEAEKPCSGHLGASDWDQGAA